MTFENIPIKPCCKYMGDTIMMNDIRESIVFNPEEPKGSEFRLTIMWSDGDCVPLLYCPSCGKKIEEESIKYMPYEQCNRCKLDHCCWSLSSFLWENGNTPNNCKEFTPKEAKEC